MITEEQKKEAYEEGRTDCIAGLDCNDFYHDVTVLQEEYWRGYNDAAKVIDE